MRIALILIALALQGFALDLVEYVGLALQESNDAYSIIDDEIYAQMEYESARNEFALSGSPNSSFSSANNYKNMQLGLQGSLKNSYGGKVSSNLYSRYSKFSSSKNYNTGFDVGYTQSIFRAGEEYNTLTLYTSKEKRTLQKLYSAQKQGAIIFKAVRLYYMVLLNRQKLAIGKKSLARSKEYLRSSQAKQKAGLVSKMDVYRANINYLTQEKALNTTQKSYQDAIEEAMLYINKMHTAFSFKARIELFKPHVANYSQAQILAKSTTWQQLLSQERILKRRISNASTNLLPSLDLSMLYRRFHNDEKLGDSLSFEQDDFSIGLNSRYAFNQFNENQTLERLQIEKNRLVRNKRALHYGLLKDMRELKLRKKNYLNDIEIEKLRMHEAKESLNVATIRYKKGIASNLDLIDAENAYLSSQISYYSTLVAFNLATLELPLQLNELNMAFLKDIASWETTSSSLSSSP